jgi:hypothetical protein
MPDHLSADLAACVMAAEADEQRQLRRVGRWYAAILAGMAAAALLAACAASLADLRAAEPYRTATVVGDMRAIATCTLDGANSLPRGHLFTLVRPGSSTYQLVDYRTESRVAVIGFAGNPPSATVEIAFAEVARDRARVEMRFSFADSIARRRYAEGLWPVLERCAGGRLQP